MLDSAPPMLRTDDAAACSECERTTATSANLSWLSSELLLPDTLRSDLESALGAGSPASSPASRLAVTMAVEVSQGGQVTPNRRSSVSPRVIMNPGFGFA